MDNSREIKIRKQIDAYIRGKLSEEEIQELWNEFAKTPELLDVLELEVNVREVIEQEALSATSGKKASITRLPSWTWPAAAAAVVLIVALTQLFRVQTPSDMQEFLVHNINPSHIETSDGVRAKDMQISTADSLLNLGFEAIINDNEQRALELFNEVISNYDEEPYGSKAFLNKGIVLYNEGDYSLSISAFEEAAKRVESNGMIAEKAQWYLGNALINVGELEQAREAVFAAYQSNGIFRKPAFRLLKKLNNELGSADYEEFNSQSLE